MLTSSRPELFSLTGFVKLTRVQNLLIIALAQYLTAIFLVGPSSEWKLYLQDINLLFISFSTVIIAAAGYMINDYYDVKIDYVNKPDQVIVGKVLTRRSVMAVHTILNFTGIFAGIMISYKIGFINFIAASLLWLYSNQLKRMPLIGNLAVSILTALSITVIAIHYNDSEVAIFLYAFFAFVTTLVREIIKDIEDMVGDEKFGSKTLPIIWGIRKTKQFIYLLSILFLAILGYLILMNYFPQINALILIIAAPVLVLNYLLYRADTKMHYYRLSLFTKFFILIGILSMVLFHH